MRLARLAILLCALAAGLAAHAEPTVILISWDGMRHDFPDRYPTPALARLEREGARADHLLPVFPSNTFPGHVSLATGTYPDRHGILDNAFYDRERGSFRMHNDASWIEAEPLWVAAERQGVVTASYFWVGSETDWHGIGATHRVAPFDSDVDEQAKVDQILAWLDLPLESRPRLILSWWHGADRAGHRHGPDHAAVASAIAEQAQALERLLAGLDARGWSETTLLLVSDHGMTPVRGAIPIAHALEAAAPQARLVDGASVAHVFVPDEAQRAAAERALAALPHTRVLRREALPAELRLDHPSRTGDLVALAEPGYVFRQAGLGTRMLGWIARLFGEQQGIHGYAPELPDMGGSFFALGHGVGTGVRLPVVRMIDVAPTVAALLGIAPPRDAEGTAVSLQPN
jgi:predicted AlkP superfamily pyrophosphatase or phosphodiesterase